MRKPRLQEAVLSPQPCSPPRGALQRGDPPFVRTDTRPALNCPAMPTGIPGTHAWPHARPRTLTSRSRPCLLWTPLRTGRGGRGARGHGLTQSTPPWRWELGVELWPAAASQNDQTGAGQGEAPNGVPPGGRGYEQLRPHSQGRNKQTLA